MVRAIPSPHWNYGRISKRVPTPCQERVQQLELIEAEENLHEHAASEVPDEVVSDQRAERRLKI